MDEAQVKALFEGLIKDALKTHQETLKSTLDAQSKALLDDVSKYVNERTEALEAHITTPETKPETPVVDADSPLAKRLALVESELAQEKEAKGVREQSNARLAFKQSITDELGKVKDLQYTGVVHELLFNRLSEGYEVKDGVTLTKSGKTLNEEVTGFLSTDEGKHFLKPVQATDTPGVKAPKAQPRSEAVKTLAQALLA